MNNKYIYAHIYIYIHTYIYNIYIYIYIYLYIIYVLYILYIYYMYYIYIIRGRAEMWNFSSSVQFDTSQVSAAQKEANLILVSKRGRVVIHSWR